MKFYELTYLITPDISEQELKTFSKKISDFILTEGGVLDKITIPIRKKLAYPIKEKKETFLTILNFHFQPMAPTSGWSAEDGDQPQPTAGGQPKVEKIEEIEKAGNPKGLENFEKKLKSENQILRYMLLTKKEAKKIKPERIRKKPDKILEKSIDHFEKAEIKSEDKKVELEKIDKKIDEILKE